MWILVTGGAKRLGAEICLSLADKGHSIVVHYNKSEEDALRVVEKCREKGVFAESIQGDFSSVSSVINFSNRYLERFPETVGLINNVGEYLISSALNTQIEDWIYVFQTNLHAPFIISKALIPSIMRLKGQIINIGVAGLNKHSANTYSTAYYLSKESLLGLTISMARELASHNVRVNMISPGILDISVDYCKIPMNRVAQCEEVCRVVNFLLDPASEYITGQNIEIAGGLGL